MSKNESIFLHPADPELEEKLKAEYPAILKWIVEGAVKYRKEGLQIPEVLKQAKEEAFRQADVVQNFLDTCCVKDASPNSYTVKTDLYYAYQQFCAESGYKAYNRSNWSAILEDKGYVSYKAKTPARLPSFGGIILNAEGLRLLKTYGAVKMRVDRDDPLQVREQLDPADRDRDLSV